MNKIAVHVPHQLLSEAVQKYLFEMGYVNEGVKTPTTLLQGYTYLIPRTDKVLDYASKIWCIQEGYTILTVDEFFKMEEEKVTTIPGWGTISVDPIGFRVISSAGGLVIAISWDELDKISTLRPKEASKP